LAERGIVVRCEADLSVAADNLLTARAPRRPAPRWTITCLQRKSERDCNLGHQ